MTTRLLRLNGVAIMLSASTKTGSLFVQEMKGTTLVVVSGLLYGFIGFFGTKILQNNVTVTAMLFWRFFIAFLYMLGIAILFPRQKERTQKIATSNSLKQIIPLTIYYALGSIFFFIGATKIGTGPAMVIFFLFPIAVTLFSWHFDDYQVVKPIVVALILMLCGLCLLKSSGTDKLNVSGMIIAFAGSLFYGAYVYRSKKYSSQLNTTRLTLWLCLGNAIFFLLLMLTTETFTIPHEAITWLYILLLSIFATALPIQCMIVGLKYISAIKASLLSVLEPTVTVVIGVWLLHESLNGWQTLGIICILASALLVQLEPKQA